MSKKNDWIAINLNAGNDVSLDSLSAYGINPNNTGLQSEDYYKNIKQVRDSFTNADGVFDDTKFHNFYESAKRSYNDYQQSDFTQKIIDEIESSPYDIFSLGSKIMDTSAAIYRSRDPQRTTMGLGNIFEVGSPTFDIREVAQANKARDEHGNVLDWTPNDKGRFIKGLFRPTMVLATYDEDGTHTENGIQVSHKKGDLKLDEVGDPYYEKLGNREIYGKETLHYWDTITRDDSAWNKIDFMDSDGLHKSIGGTVMRTAFSLLPYFTPIGPYLGYVGAAVALGQTLPVLSKAINGVFTGTNDNAFGRSMSSLEAFMDRFGHSQSRDTMGKFLSFENIGDIVASSAGQLFQQRMIANIPNLLRKSNDATSILATSKFGRNLALGYMITTSANDAYATFKEAGATDRMAGIGLLGVTSGFALLMNNNYFKDAWFTGTFMDEDIAARDTVKQLIKESTIEPFEQYAAIAPKATSKYQQKLANTWLYKQIEKNIIDKIKPFFEKIVETRPTVGMVERASASEVDKGVKIGMKASMYLNRMLNEGLEETMEEGITDAMKLVTIGLDALGVQVSKPDQNLDFGLTLRDAISRYTAAFLGGAIGGAVFEGFNQFEGGEYDSLLEKSLVERLAWYERNGYGQEIRERIKRLYKKGKLGNANLSSKGTRIKSVDGKEVVVYGQGDENDNQNLFVYNVINSYLDRLHNAIENNGLFSDNKIFDEILKSVRERHQGDDSDPEIQLYHFLEDVDTAKALTIEQMGFLNAVKEDADRLSFDILHKTDEIERTKQKLRAEHHLTDADSTQEKEIFRNSQLLKTLEAELKEMKDAWDKILKGERNGYYMGYAKMMATPAYSDWYTNPNSIQNQSEPFPKTDLDNWSKYNYGVRYSEVTEEELKKKIEDDWQAYNDIIGSSETSSEEQLKAWRRKSRRLYDLHIKFSETFAPDILHLAEELKDSAVIDDVTFLSDEFKKFAESHPSLVVKGAYDAFAKSMEEALNEEDVNKRGDLQKVAFAKFLVDAFAFADSYSEKLKFLKQIDDARIAGGFVGLDLSGIRQAIAESITTEIRGKLESDPMKAHFNELAGIFGFNDPDKLNSLSIEQIKSIIDSLSDEEMSLIDNIPEDFESVDELDEQFLGQLSEVLNSRRPLFSGEALSDFMMKLKTLLDAIEANSTDIENRYNELKQFILDNTKSYGSWDTPFTEKDADDLINFILGDGVADTFIEERKKETFSNYNPFEAFLKKFDAFTGGRLFNTIEILTKEEAFLDSLKDASDFKLTEARENELKTALSFLNVICAVITSSIDGMNEAINLSKPEIELAVIDPQLTRVIEPLLSQIANRINLLINLSNQNKIKTTKAQQETMLNTNKKRVKQLVNIGEIDFGGGFKINFEEEWNKEGFLLENATLENAKGFDLAFRHWQSSISKKLQQIAKENSADLLNGFIIPLIQKFGKDVYMLNPGEITNDETKDIPPYAQVMYLLTLVELDADTFNSIWKSVCLKNPELIPLFGQEYLVRENLASMISAKSGLGLFAIAHQYLKDTFPKTKADGSSWTASEFIEKREILDHFINTDGIGGTGKTVGVDYLTNESAKLYYKGNVSAIALGGTLEAAKGVHTALKLGVDAISPMDFDGFMKAICTDESGKVLFDYEKALKKPTEKTPGTLRRDKDGNVVDDKGNTLSKINVDKLKTFFPSKDGLHVIYFDETGLINISQALLLNEIAKIHGFFICGSGDTLQNKASFGEGNLSSGIEDAIYHKTASLTISMRSQNSGVYKNVEIIKSLLRTVQDACWNDDPSTRPEVFSDKMGEQINALKAGTNNIKLVYSEETLAGHRFIDRGDLQTYATKALKLITELKESDPDNIHQLAIVAHLDKHIHYRELFKDAIASGDVVVIDPKSVQGHEYDFAIIDKEYDTTNKFFAVQDFYTMMTRAKRGAAFVDDKTIRDSIGIEDNLDETASQSVSGSTPEEKAELFKKYVDWRMSLMEDIPEFSGTVSTSTSGETGTGTGTGTGTSTGTVTGGGGTGSGSTAGGSSTEAPEVKATIIGGTAPDWNPADKTEEEILAHYEQELLEDPKDGQLPHARNLAARQKALSPSNSRTMADSDLLIGELKAYDRETNTFRNPGFETNPLSIVSVQKLDCSTNEQVMAHRVIIATIARAILNNQTSENRQKYLQDAAKYLASKFNILGGSTSIITSLQNSFSEGDNKGFFFYDEKYIYYSFTHDTEQYAIPIMIHSRPDLKGSIFEDIQFKLEIGSIPISSNGEIMRPSHDVVSEIDGIVVDENDNPTIQIGITPAAIRDELERQWKLEGTDAVIATIRRALRFIHNNRGKAFIALNAASSTFKLGKDFFKPILDGKSNYLSAVDQVYDSDKMDAVLVGLQQITSLSDWFEVIGILSSYANKAIDSSNDARLSEFFHLPSTAISTEFNKVSEENKPISDNYRLLGKYSILNHSAVDNLTSAIFRYLSANPDVKWASQYWEGFIKWLQRVRTTNDGDVHRRGFTVRFKTADSEGRVILHDLIVCPKIVQEGTDKKQAVIGYDILHSSTDHLKPEQIYSSNPNDETDTPYGLFGNTSFDFVSGIKAVLDKIKEKEPWANVENIEELIQNGGLIIFPTDFMYSAKANGESVGLPQRIYSAYETDVYDWMTGRSSSDSYKLTAQDVTDLEEFLLKDTVFKHNLYRDIKAEYQDGETNIWAAAKNVSLRNTHIDIIKMIAPLYELLTTSALSKDTDKYKTLRSKLNGFFEKGSDADGNDPFIDGDVTQLKSINGTITFVDNPIIVNAVWLNTYSTKTDWQKGQYLIKGFIPFTGELVLSDGTKVLLKQEGTNNFLDAVDGTYANIKNAISKITISSVDGNAIIMGYSVRFTDGTIYNNIELIGKSGNYYFFRSGTAEFNIKLSDDEASKLNGLKTVSARGEYIGSAEDTLQKWYLYRYGENIYMMDLTPDEVVSEPINISDIVFNDDSVEINGFTIDNKTIVNTLKSMRDKTTVPTFKDLHGFQVRNSDIVILLGAHSLNADQMRLLAQDPEVVDGENYHIFAYNPIQIAYYIGNDLSTLQWADIKHFDPSAIKVDRFTGDDLDVDNLVESFLQLLEREKQEAIEKFIDPNSEDGEYTYRVLENGELVTKREKDYVLDGISVKHRRAIMKYLNSNTTELSDVSIFKEVGKENLPTIIVTYNSGGKPYRILVKIDKDMHVHLQSNDKISEFESIKSKFNSIFEQLEKAYNDYNDILNGSSALSPDQVLAVKQKRDQIAHVLESLSIFKEKIENGTIDSKTFVQTKNTVPSEYKDIVNEYYKAYKQQTNC